MSALMSVAFGRGLMLTLFEMPTTPSIPRMSCSAAAFWNCHATSPVRMTQPFSTFTFTVSSGTETFQSRRWTTATAISSSLRLA